MSLLDQKPRSNRDDEFLSRRQRHKSETMSNQSTRHNQQRLTMIKTGKPLKRCGLVAKYSKQSKQGCSLLNEANSTLQKTKFKRRHLRVT